MSYIPVNWKLSSLLVRRHTEVLPSAENSPVPMAITNAIAATCTHFRRRSRPDHRNSSHQLMAPYQCRSTMEAVPPSGAPSWTMRPPLSSTTRSAIREISRL